LGQANDKMA